MKFPYIKRSVQKSNAVYRITILFFLIIQPVYFSGTMQQTLSWSVPRTIPGYQLNAITPLLVADQNQTVYAFSSQMINNGFGGEVRVIIYNQWTLEDGWTAPVDIILSPIKEARLTDVQLDSKGVFHLIFWGGDNTDANIYYSTASVFHANNANGWSKPIIIGRNAGDPENAVMIIDERGDALYVLYNGRQVGNGLYMVRSDIKGQDWSGAFPIFLTSIDKPNIDELHFLMDSTGKMHAVWGTYNASAQGRGIYYARSDDGEAWSDPILLADALDGLGTQRPTFIEYNKSLVVVYNLSLKVMMRRSFDFGLSWENPSILFPRHTGLNGSMSLVEDSNNTLYLFFGQRVSGEPDIHGMWYSTFENIYWMEPRAIIKGPQIRDLSGMQGFDPGFARAVVSQGNVILVTWKTDPTSKPNGVWYSFTKVEAPELPTKVSPLSIDLDPSNSVITATPVDGSLLLSTLPSPTLTVNDIRSINHKDAAQNNPGFPIIVAITVALIILVIVVVVYRRSKISL